jgi:tetratricopeptide (TPR) repeat protein
VGTDARLAKACYSAIFYVSRTVLPVGIAAFYPAPAQLDATEPRFLLPILLVAAISVGVIAAWRRAPALGAAWFAYLALLAPVSGLIRIGEQIAADRYSYVPMMALTVLVGVSLARLQVAGTSRPALRAVVVAIGLAIVPLIVLTRAQCRIWSSSAALWADAYARGGDRNATVCNNLGTALAQEGKIDQAELLFRSTIRWNPQYASAHNNLGLVQVRRGDLVAATRSFREAVRLDPEDAEAQENLGTALLEQGDAQSALPCLAEAVRLRPDSPGIRRTLQEAQARLGHPESEP